MNVLEIKYYADAVLDALNDLLPQLSSSPERLTEQKLLEIIHSDTTHLLMAEENDQYVGSLTLVVFKIPSGTRVRIEDLVVLETARGRGAGKSLVLKAVEMADALGVEAVELTTHPSREAAGALYEKLGFKIRDTYVYRLEIST
jgi:ribosomal protein S18 acetylase RimI-like enzyme